MRVQIAAFLLVSACTGVTPFDPPPDDVAILTDADVASCTPTRIYTTTVGVSGSAVQDRAIEIARNETLREAGSDGANAVVFEAGAPGESAFFVRARGYVC